MANATEAEQYGFNIIADSNGNIEFISSNPKGGAKSSPKHREISQHIVRCVNKHERLVEALRHYQQTIGKSFVGPEFDDEVTDLLAELDKGEER